MYNRIELLCQVKQLLNEKKNIAPFIYQNEDQLLLIINNMPNHFKTTMNKNKTFLIAEQVIFFHDENLKEIYTALNATSKEVADFYEKHIVEAKRKKVKVMEVFNESR